MTYWTLKIILCLFLQATPNDGLPPIVCIKCREQLNSCHRFHRVAHQTNQALIDYLQFTSKLNGTPQVSSSFSQFFLVHRKLCIASYVKSSDRSALKFSLNKFFQSNDLWVLCANFFSSICLFIMQFNCDKSRCKESANTPECVVWHLNTAAHRECERGNY